MFKEEVKQQLLLFVKNDSFCCRYLFVYVHIQRYYIFNQTEYIDTSFYGNETTNIKTLNHCKKIYIISNDDDNNQYNMQHRNCVQIVGSYITTNTDANKNEYTRNQQLLKCCNPYLNYTHLKKPQQL